MLTKFLPGGKLQMSAASANLEIKNIGQISIIVHDLPRATAFYRDALGLPLLFTAGKLAFFDCGGVRLMLGPAETPELDHPSSILYFRVSDLTAAHQRLLDAAGQVLAPPRLIAPMPTYDLRLDSFRGSHGNHPRL